ncbi:MAG TPA: AMP-binding protein [Pirellulales bacterium]|nr:AMP-binding protein [Pirellulales bacterium]
MSGPDELWQHWQRLPIVTKQHLQDHFDPIKMVAELGLQGKASSTGGSTGEPTRYFHDHAMLRASMAGQLFVRQEQGWRLGMPLIRIWGSERDIGRQATLRNRVSLRVQNHWLIDGYRMDEHTVDRVCQLINRLQPVALMGFTTMLEFFADACLRRNETFPPGAIRTAWNGGEMLFDHQIELAKRVFGVPILNNYGGRELLAMAYQTGENTALKVVRPWLFLEIVDQQGRVVGPGETGRLIWTSTICRGTPFLRYDCGDLGTYQAEHCDESGIYCISQLEGRSAGLIKLPSGKSINNIFWNHLLKEYPAVKQFQVAVLPGPRVELRLCGTPFSESQDREVRNLLFQLLEGLPSDIKWVPAISRTAQGKLVQVVQEPEPVT